jgi:hypothetical protein
MDEDEIEEGEEEEPLNEAEQKAYLKKICGA